MNNLMSNHNGTTRKAFVAVVMTTALIVAFSISHPVGKAWAINTIDDYENAIRKVKKGDTFTMFIKRVNSGFFVIKLTK